MTGSTSSRRLRAVPATAPRAVLYLRQSVSREESISLELQEIAGRAYCEQRGYEVVEVLADPGISGRTWDRPAVQRAVGMVEAGEVAVIVVWKWSRLSRSRRDWAVAVDRVEAAGGRLESSTEPVDTTTSTGRFTRGMLAELAAFESERIGDTWRETHRRRQSLGLPHTGGERLGYIYDRGTKTYAVDPETGPVLRDLYERYLAGEGMQMLADHLDVLGIRAPRTGTRWTRGGLIFMLDSGFAAGLLRIHDPDCVRAHKGRTRCPQRIHVPGAHEALITAEQWAAYLEARRSRATLPPRLASPVTRLSGVLRCLRCGRRMTINRYADQAARYGCQNRECTGPSSVAIPRAEAAVLAWLPTVAQLVDQHAASAVPTTSASAGVERARLARVASEAERALTNLAIDRAKRLLPESAYIGARDALLAQREQAQTALEKMAAVRVNAAELARTAAALLEDWETIAPADCSRIMQELAVVWVHREPGTPRPTIEVLGAWEQQPR